MNHVADTVGEFYGETACATEIAFDGAIYGPSAIPAGNSPGGFTPISQSAVTGSGTNVDPYKTVTVVDVGTATGIRISETDSYVVGQEAYRTDVEVINMGAASKSVIVYRGGDCYLQNSDYGFGSIGNPAGAVACVAAADPNNPSGGPGARIEQWVPLTAGSHFFEERYSTVWQAMSAKLDFPDTCICATYTDNGAGLSWALTIPAGQARTVSHLTNFSPLGNLPLSTTKTADQASVAAGAQDGYTITVSNPNSSAVSLASITDTLPSGFSYVANSTTQATTSNPGIVGQVLTWTGPFNVPANGTLTLHFSVTVSSAAGDYFNNATANAGSFAVVPTGNTAPINVTGAVNPPPTGSIGGPYSGVEGAAIGLSGTASDPTNEPLTTTWSVTPSSGTDPGAACTIAAPNSLATTVTCNDDGSYQLQLLISDGTTTLALGTGLTVSNAAPTVQITSPADLSQFLLGTSTTVTSTFTDAGSNDTHTCLIDWGDGTLPAAPPVVAGGCSTSHTYASIGVYTIIVYITDDDGGQGSASIMVVVYDIQTKVTGGGFVVNNGRTSFGFVAKSNTAGGFIGQIQLRAPGNDRFHGNTVGALSVSGNTASWSGTGKWNGVDGYTFSASVVDTGTGGGKNKSPDSLSVTVRNGAGAIVFTTGGELKGGNIVVHN